MPDHEIATVREAGLGRLPALSLAAVEAVAARRLGDAAEICTRLYCWQRIPYGPRWRSELPGSRRLARLAAKSGWHQRLSIAQAGGWLMMLRDDARADQPSQDFGYKLYLSPKPTDVADALAIGTAVAARVGVSRFKTGADPLGLLRPDKIVFYCTSADETAQLATELGSALRGCPAHGVPFTAPLDRSGLLSWAGDPVGADGPRESWRLFVCRRLGELLATGIGPEQALHRLAADGVVVPEFAPQSLVPPDVDTRSAA